MNREQMVERAAVALFESPDYLARKGVGVDDARTVLDAILPQVSTVAELEALHPRAWVIDRLGFVARPGSLMARGAVEHGAVLTVVWTPDEVTA